MADDDLERPSLVPGWVYVIVIALAVFGAFAIVGWIIRAAFGVARSLLFILLVIGVIALVRAVVKRR